MCLRACMHACSRPRVHAHLYCACVHTHTCLRTRACTRALTHTDTAMHRHTARNSLAHMQPPAQLLTRASTHVRMHAPAHARTCRQRPQGRRGMPGGTRRGLLRHMSMHKSTHTHVDDNHRAGSVRSGHDVWKIDEVDAGVAQQLAVHNLLICHCNTPLPPAAAAASPAPAPAPLSPPLRPPPQTPGPPPPPLPSSRECANMRVHTDRQTDRQTDRERKRSHL